MKKKFLVIYIDPHHEYHDDAYDQIIVRESLTLVEAVIIGQMVKNKYSGLKDLMIFQDARQVSLEEIATNEVREYINTLNQIQFRSKKPLTMSQIVMWWRYSKIVRVKDEKEFTYDELKKKYLSKTF